MKLSEVLEVWRVHSSNATSGRPHCVWLQDVDVGLEYVVIACHLHVICITTRWSSCDGLMFVDVC